MRVAHSRRLARADVRPPFDAEAGSSSPGVVLDPQMNYRPASLSVSSCVCPSVFFVSFCSDSRPFTPSSVGNFLIWVRQIRGLNRAQYARPHVSRTLVMDAKIPKALAW